MDRRSFLKVSAATGLMVVIGGCGIIPPIPDRPEASFSGALGWVHYENGRYHLIIPRAEMGQGIGIAMRQIAAAELDINLGSLAISWQNTTALDPVKSTVGSESIKDFAYPLAQACATLRDAVEAGQDLGLLEVVERPVGDLLSFKKGTLVGVSPQDDTHISLVKGDALFASDMRIEGMVYGRVLRAPRSLERPSRPVQWNESAARKIIGFEAIIEEDTLQYGQSVGLGIIAKTPGALDRISEVLDIQWGYDDPSDDVVFGPLPKPEWFQKSKEPMISQVDGTDHKKLVFSMHIAPGAHNAIEPRVAVAHWDQGRMKIWTGSQDIYYVRDVVERSTGLNADAIEVQGMRIGGAFGGKTICMVELEAAILSKAHGKAVKIQWTREQEYAQAFHRPEVYHHIEIEANDKTITSWNHHCASSHILFTSAVLPRWIQGITDQFMRDDGVARGSNPPYKIQEKSSEFQLTRLGYHTGPWRGLGAAPNGLLVESAIDEMARAFDQDPLDYRLAQCDDTRLRGTLKHVRDLANWDKRDSQDSQGRRIGYGVACGIYKESSYSATIAKVIIEDDGHTQVEHIWCSHDCGLVFNPDQVKAQCEGNIVWSMGLIFKDHMQQEDGRITSTSFADAPLITYDEMPGLTIGLVASNEAPTGAGETAMVCVPGAIVNAIRDATGVRLSHFPMEEDGVRRG